MSPTPPWEARVDLGPSPPYINTGQLNRSCTRTKILLYRLTLGDSVTPYCGEITCGEAKLKHLNLKRTEANLLDAFEWPMFETVF